MKDRTKKKSITKKDPEKHESSELICKTFNLSHKTEITSQKITSILNKSNVKRTKKTKQSSIMMKRRGIMISHPQLVYNNNNNNN